MAILRGVALTALLAACGSSRTNGAAAREPEPECDWVKQMDALPVVPPPPAIATDAGVSQEPAR